MDASTLSGYPDSWGPQGYVRAFFLQSFAFAIFWSCYWWWDAEVTNLSFFQECHWFCSEWFTAMLPPTSSTLHCFKFSFSCQLQRGRREWRKISSHYFSILCCLNNIHNKPGGKSLIECHRFSTVWVYFLYFYSPQRIENKLNSVK